VYSRGNHQAFEPIESRIIWRGERINEFEYFDKSSVSLGLHHNCVRRNIDIPHTPLSFRTIVAMDIMMVQKALLPNPDGRRKIVSVLLIISTKV
jgi:hypothetical protein